MAHLHSYLIDIHLRNDYFAVSQKSYRKKGFSYAEVLPQKPYIEQQFPFGQFPQTVPPLELPHVPSVVVGAAALAETVVLTGVMTGSWVEVVTCVVPPVQPFWQPFETKQ